MAALQQLRRKAAIVEGPGVGQVLPVTRLPPKQSRSVCSAPVGAAPGTVTKAPFSGDWSWMQLPGEPHVLPRPQRWRCRAPLSPAPGQTDAGSAPGSAGWVWWVWRVWFIHSSAAQSPVLPSRCCTNTSRAGCPTGTKSVPGQSHRRGLFLLPSCAREPSGTPVPAQRYPGSRPAVSQLYPSPIPAPSPSTARRTSTLGTKDLQQGEEGSAPAGGSWIGAEPTAEPAPAKPVAEKFPSFLSAPAKGT